MKDSAGGLVSRISDILSNTQTFALSLDLLNKPPETLTAHKDDEIEKLAGDVPGMGIWLNQMARAHKMASLRTTDVKRLRAVAHPYHLTEKYIPWYADLESRLPDDLRNVLRQDTRTVETALNDVKERRQKCVKA